MKQIQYNKLVRDRIPEIIEASGKTCVTEILSDEAYLKMVDAKLDEEFAEYTFATMALENGMDVKTLSATIGHVSAATT